METDKNTAELISCATDCIPSGYRYELKDVEGTSKQWVAKLLCNISSIEDVQVFVRKYVDLNGETVKPRIKRLGRIGVVSYYKLIIVVSMIPGLKRQEMFPLF